MRLISTNKGQIMESTTEKTAHEVNVDKAKQLIESDNREAVATAIADLYDRLDKKDEALANYRQSESNRVKQLFDARAAVRNFFKEEFDGDKDAVVSFTLDEVNNLLDLIDADKLCFTYSATVKIEFTVTGIEADSEEEAERLIHDSLDYRLTGELRNANIEMDEVEVEDVEAE